VSYTKDLGKLLAIHPASPAAMQRAAVIGVLAFVFFFAMLLAFYVRQAIGYFVLSTAFLVVHLFTLAGIWMRKRSSLSIYENGIAYRGCSAMWSQIDRIEVLADGGLWIDRSSGDPIVIEPSIHRLAEVAAFAKDRIGRC
jgi:hypothetical protein